jgi:cytochrome c biogenesis protein CcmG/thiol:disulfide interchange protein DsbE
MRHWLLVVSALFFATASPAYAVAVGDPAPEISVTQADGKPVTLRSLRGKTVYLDFWASWCGPCRQSFPFMNQMQQKYAKDGLVVVGINLDKRRADAERFLAKIPSSFTIVYDEAGRTPAAYQVKKMPTSVLIDYEGQIASIHAGFEDRTREDVERRIRNVLSVR